VQNRPKKGWHLKRVMPKPKPSFTFSLPSPSQAKDKQPMHVLHLRMLLTDPLPRHQRQKEKI